MILDGTKFQKDVVILDSNMFMTSYMRDYVKNNLVDAILQCREAGNSEYVVYIPRTVFDELESLKNKQGTQFLSERTEALRGIEAAKDLIKAGLARPLKSDFTGAANGFNDVAMLTMLMELRRHTNVAVLSNDRALARDLIVLNSLQSVKTDKVIRSFYINMKRLIVQQWLYDEKHDKAVRYEHEFDK